MARATFVKAARKDYPDHGIKKGDSYYHWAFMSGGRGGPKRFSKTPPTRQQLTQSEFYSAQYDLEDRIGDLTGTKAEGLEGERDSIADDIEALGEEQEEKLQNMPEGLQQGSTGEMLQSRKDGCDQWAQDLRNVECDLTKEEDESDEDFADRVEAAIEEIQGCEYQGE